jgi:hypothetical protein
MHPLRRLADAPWAPPLATAAVAAFPLAALLYVSVSRLGYPWSLEWIEGACVAMARRFADGLPVYVEPSAEHVALPYYPLYFVVTGVLLKATGAVYWAGRLVSLLAALATGGLVFWTVNRAVKRPAAGLVAAGMWFAAYGYSGFFYDLNRVDSLAMFFLMAAYAAAFARPGAAAGAIGGLLLAASALTKQNHAAFLAPILVAQLLRRDFRGAAAFFAAFLGPFGTAHWLWNRQSGGWFALLTEEVVVIDVVASRPFEFFAQYGRHFAAAAAVILLGVEPLIRDRRWRDLLGDPWFGFWAGGVALSLVCNLWPAAYINANMPAALATSVAAGMALPAMVARFAGKGDGPPRTATRWVLPVLAAALVFGAYSPIKGQIPTTAQWVAAQKLRDVIRAERGPVLIEDFAPPEPNVLPFHEIAMYDMGLGAERVLWKKTWTWKLRGELAAAQPTAVFSQGDLRNAPSYARVVAGMTHERLPRSLRVCTVTGKFTTLEHVYRRPASAAVVHDVAPKVPGE